MGTGLCRSASTGSAAGLALGGGSSFAHPGSIHTIVDHSSVGGSVESADSQMFERMLFLTL